MALLYVFTWRPVALQVCVTEETDSAHQKHYHRAVIQII